MKPELQEHNHISRIAVQHFSQGKHENADHNLTEDYKGELQDLEGGFHQELQWFVEDSEDEACSDEEDCGKDRFRLKNFYHFGHDVEKSVHCETA